MRPGFLTSIHFVPLLLLAGVGNVLLPAGARQQRDRSRVHVGRAPALLLIASLLYAAVLLWQLPLVVRVLGGANYVPDVRAVIGWLLVALTLALSQGVAVRALVQLPSRRVFVLRAAGTLSSVLLTLLAAAVGSVSLMPYALASGAAVTALSLDHALRRARRGRPEGAVPATS